MEVMIESKASLSELLKEIKIYPQLLVNVKVKDKKAVKTNSAVTQIVSNVEEELGTEGRILVRESGTEQLVRVMVEAKTKELCKQYVDQVIDVIKAQGFAI